MPWIVNSETGARERVPDATAQRLTASGEWQYDKGERITVTSGAQTYSVPADQAAALPLPQEAPEARVERESQHRIEERYSTGSERVKNVAENVAGGVTLGGSSALLRALYGDEYAQEASRRRQADPMLAAGSEIGGAVAAALATGGATAGASGAARGAGAAARFLPAAQADLAGAAVSRALGGGIKGAFGRGAAEGALYGAGSGLHEVMGAEDPVTLERTLSAVGTGALTGAAVGGVGGAAAKGIEKAVAGARDLVGTVAAKRAARVAGEGVEEGAQGIADSMAIYEDAGKEVYLLAKGKQSGRLGSARTKLERLRDTPDDLVGKKAAVDALKKERAVLEEMADAGDANMGNLVEHDKRVVARLEQKTKKAAIKVKQVEADIVAKQKEIAALGEVAEEFNAKIAKQQGRLAKATKAGKGADARIIRSKINKLERDLAKKTDPAKLEAKLEELVQRKKDVRIKLDDDGWQAQKYEIDLGNELRDFRGGGTTKPKQATIEEVNKWIGGLKDGALSDRRRAALGQIPDLIAENKALAESLTPQGKTLMGELGDALTSKATGQTSALIAGAIGGGPLGMAAALVAPRVIKRIADKVGPQFTKAAADVAERQARALGAVLDVTAKTTRVATPSASKVLASSSFGAGTGPKQPGTLLDSFKAREKELLDQVQASPEGLKMSRPARRRVADNLRGIKAVDPLTADRLESQAARRVEFLAGKLPKRPRVAVGNWQPPNSEIRKFARYVAAVEDPSSVLERAASGTISPEGAEALRTVYPEQFADIQRQVIETLPELRDKLPRDKRIALSILTGIPIDPAMEPRILARLQATYATEPGTEGGAQAPTPQPSFGSVSREQPTKAQRRAGDERTA